MTLFISGLMAVVNFASIFMTEALAMTQKEIIMMFAVLQLAGVAGAFGFGWLQDRIGSKIALVASLIIWVVVSVWAAVCQTKGEFLYVGILAGIAMGSLQSSGRAVVSALTPAGRSGEFFGYWGFFGKLAGVIGPLVFGWLATWFNSRVAVGVNALFFLGGLVIVLTLKFPAAKGVEGK
jgi:MFS transporter, UMF1 family